MQEGNQFDQESTCFCIAELCTRVHSPALASQLPLLVKTLLARCAADVWTVRDAACVAIGKVVTAYPEHCHSQMSAIFFKLLQHLREPIWSLREDSAIALGQVSHCHLGMIWLSDWSCMSEVQVGL